LPLISKLPPHRYMLRFLANRSLYGEVKMQFCTSETIQSAKEMLRNDAKTMYLVYER